MEAEAGALGTVLSLAIGWAQSIEHWIRREGRRLRLDELHLAASMGVKRPQEIRVWVADEVPIAPEDRLRDFADERGMRIDTLDGMTFGYGIFLRHGKEADEALIKHEFRHVFQTELFGAFDEFVSLYVKQLEWHGYYNAPLEVDARAASTRD